MAERFVDQRTMVGVPFYDGEGQEVLEACLSNLDRCLNGLGVDAEVVIAINGPRVNRGLDPLSYGVDRSKYNADISFVRTRPGIVRATEAIGNYAATRGYSRAFITDADVSRLPLSLRNMWENGDRPVVGATYSAYPLEVLTGSGTDLSDDEIALMGIFEADKHPLAREFTDRHRPPLRLKGSLLLVDPRVISPMYSGQNITTDSVMNGAVPPSDRQVVPDAAFMHFARVDVTDHVQGRLRHYRAAHATGRLSAFARTQLIYRPNIADEIARSIAMKHPGAMGVASNFLLQCALRHAVGDIGVRVAARKKYTPPTSVSSDRIDLTVPVRTFSEARGKIDSYLGLVNWNALDEPVTSGSGTTNQQMRVPIDLDPYLESQEDRALILAYLGLPAQANI